RIPTVSLYYDQGKGERYRSLGCWPCTKSVASDAKDVKEIIVELKSGRYANIAERSGRAQDKDDGGGLESLRREGYMWSTSTRRSPSRVLDPLIGPPCLTPLITPQ